MSVPRQIFLLIALVLFSGAILADEVRLICEGVVTDSVRQKSGEHINPNTGKSEPDYMNIPTKVDVLREIRFDEESGEFWYKGATWLSSDGSEDGWVPAVEVEFTDDLITARFKPGGRKKLADILSFGITALTNKPIGELDRYSGIWRMNGAGITCRKLETEERKF